MDWFSIDFVILVVAIGNDLVIRTDTRSYSHPHLAVGNPCQTHFRSLELQSLSISNIRDKKGLKCKTYAEISIKCFFFIYIIINK